MLALVLLCLSSGPEDWRAALEAGEYRRAWEQGSALADPVERARAEACILYQAGDPAGALAAARKGLEVEPRQLELLFYASGSAVWLGEAGPALHASESLVQALNGAELEPDERAAWERTAREHVELAQALAAKEKTIAQALGVASWGALLGLAAAVGGMFALARGLRSEGQPASRTEP